MLQIPKRAARRKKYIPFPRDGKGHELSICSILLTLKNSVNWWFFRSMIVMAKENESYSMLNTFSKVRREKKNI